MSLYHRPGWAQPNGHVVRSKMEAALCDYLSAAVEPHVHGPSAGLNFNVPIGPNRKALYVPSIVLTHSKKDNLTIIIESINSVRPGGGVRRLQGFRHQRQGEYFVILVARRALHHDIPEDAYDLLFPLEDFTPLDQFLTSL